MYFCIRSTQTYRCRLRMSLSPEAANLLFTFITSHEDSHKRTVLFYTIDAVVPYRDLEELIPASHASESHCVYEDKNGNRYDAFGAMINYEEARIRMLNCTKWLLEYGADPNHMDMIGLTPLLVAITMIQDPNECAEMCEVLLQRGANPNLCGKHMTSPLLAAVIKQNFAVVKLLVDYGANVNAEYQTDFPLLLRCGETALGLAARTGQRDIAFYLANTRKHKLQTLLRALTQPDVDTFTKQDILNVFECFSPAQSSKPASRIYM